MAGTTRFAVVVASILLLLPGLLRPCTSFVFQSKGTLIFGSNYDNSIWPGLLFVNRKGVQKTGWEPGTTGRVAQWTAKYGSVTFNVAGLQLAWAGMNEAGLVMSTMLLSGTKNPPPDERPPLRSAFWMQYLLDTCASVEEVVAADKAVRMSETVDHYLVADSTGDAAAVEFLDGRMVVHRGESMPFKVLANWPYAKCAEALKRGETKDLRPYHSVARMSRVVERLKAFGSRGKGPAVDMAFETLADVDSDSTQWSIVFDIAGRVVHFRSSRNTERRSIDLQKLDFACGQPVGTLDVHAPLRGDISAAFKPYEPEAGVAFTLRFLKESGIAFPEEQIRALLQAFESFPCK
ncbi:MAG: linear amide C-N hydrolase [Candidatus Aminicenantes bacterium]|nr:linear amide C-N hydrolase [Candidatus Aminicenantes bacterium]